MLTREGRRRQVRFRKKTVLYAAGVLACGNIALQALGFVYRVMLSRFAGAEGLGMYRLANSVYLVLHTGCLSGVTMACSRLSAACEATGEKGKTGAVLRLAFSVFFSLAFASAAGLLLCGDQIAAGILGNPHAAQAFPFMLLCLMLTGIENILKALFIGLECVQYTVISETGEQLVRIAAVGVLLHTVGGDCGTMAKLIFAGMAVSEVFSVLLLSLLFRRERGEAHRTAVRVDAALARQFAAIAIPLSLSALAANLLSAAGSVILPRRLMAAGLDAEQALAALGTLSGMDLTLADYAVTMTLAQLPDVARVRITVAGNNLDYRSRQVFLTRDILFAPKEDVVGTVAVQLYFPNEDGALTPEDQTLSLYEGDTQVSAVVRALENGPETKELLPVLPDGFKVRKTWLEEGTCYVSLSSALLDGQPDPASLTQAVASLEQSLLSLETVEDVCFLVDGELSETYGPVKLPD